MSVVTLVEFPIYAEVGRREWVNPAMVVRVLYGGPAWVSPRCVSIEMLGGTHVRVESDSPEAVVAALAEIEVKP